MPNAIDIRLETTQEQLQTDKAAIADAKELKIKSQEPLTDINSGSPLKEAKFVEFIAVGAVVSITWLIKRITDHWLKREEQGVQIDLQTAPPTISVVANVPQGFVVIIDKDGKATTKQAQYEKSDDLNAWLQATLQKTGSVNV